MVPSFRRGVGWIGGGGAAEVLMRQLVIPAFGLDGGLSFHGACTVSCQMTIASVSRLSVRVVGLLGATKGWGLRSRCSLAGFGSILLWDGLGGDFWRRWERSRRPLRSQDPLVCRSRLSLCLRRRGECLRLGCLLRDWLRECFRAL